MKKTLTKKLVISITALLLVGVLVFCVACQGDPYAGNYQAVAEEDRNEVVTNTTTKLEEIYENGLHNVEFNYKLKSSSKENEETISQNDITVTMIVDGSKVCVEIDYDETKDGKTTKFTSTVWYDAETEEAWYKVVTPSETYEAKWDNNAPAEEVQMAVMISVLLAPSMVTQVLEQFANALEDSAQELYTDGEKIKIVAETTEGNETNKGEGYLITNEDGSFRFKMENTSEKIDGTKKENEYNFAEMYSSTQTVTMPELD